MKNDANKQVLKLEFSGRIDSTNAQALEDEVFAAVEAMGEELGGVLIDAEKLEYISSAGLRVLMKLRKELSAVTIENVSLNVYEIFEMTGFTELLEVHKALRKISVEGCEYIGAGGFGTVYRLNADTIIKVYHEGIQQAFIEKEREASKRAFVLGIPTAIPFDIVKVGDQYGVIYEMLDARTIAQLIDADNTRLEELGRLSARALKDFHQITPDKGDFPEDKQKFRNWLEEISDYLEPEEKQRISNFLESIPDRNTFLHGDYNSKNIMIRNGEVLLIDIGDATIGHPVFDLAGLMIAYLCLPRSPRKPEEKKHLLGFDPELAPKMWAVMCGTYFGTEDPAEIRRITGMITPVMQLLLGYIPFCQNAMTEEEIRRQVEHILRPGLLKTLEQGIVFDFKDI